MKNVLALVLAGGRVDELSVLTLFRPKSAVPFGGMYRVIDFCLSNLMHSGVEKVGILSQYRSYSLINHIGIGSSWDFVGRDRGATLLIPSTGHKNRDWYKGTSDSVYQNLEYVQEQEARSILILSGDHIYRMDYNQMLNYHLEKDADITVAFTKIKPEESSRFGVAEIDDEDGETGGRIIEYLEKPENSQHCWASLTIYIFKPEVLYDVLKVNAEGNGSHEFGRDIIPAMVGKYKVFGFKFYDYWGYTRTIDEYWRTSMSLLGPNPEIRLEEWQVRTNLDHDGLRDRPPAVISDSGYISNSCIQNGCEIHGEVENSILFPGVVIEPGARVKDSVLFFDTIVQKDAVVDHTITDFDVIIGKGCRIGHGDNDSPNMSFPKLLNSGINLIGKGAHLPAGVSLGRNCIVSPALNEKQFEKTAYETGLTIT